MPRRQRYRCLQRLRRVLPNHLRSAARATSASSRITISKRRLDIRSCGFMKRRTRFKTATDLIPTWFTTTTADGWEWTARCLADSEAKEANGRASFLPALVRDSAGLARGRLNFGATVL